jgi:type I restriction enzyme S subunit
VLLALSAEAGVNPRPDDGGRQLPAETTISDYWLVRPGDIVFNPMWAMFGGVAESTIEGAVSPAYRVYEPGPLLVPRFLHYFLRSRPALAQYALVVRGLTTFDRSVAREDAEGMPIPVPPLDQQRAIADYLDAETAWIDALIAKKRRMISLLEERWQNTMHDGVAGALTSRDENRSSPIPWLTAMPATWREAKLNLVARLGSGHTPSRRHPEWWDEPTIPWITTGEVARMRSDRIELVTKTREMISRKGLANSSAELHPAGTVVLCRTASAGYSAIMSKEMATSQDFATWTCGALLKPRFLLLCLRVMRQDLLGRLAMGSTHQTIYMPDIESIKVPLPPIQEQDAIVQAVYERLPELDRAIQGLTRQIDLLSERCRALITAAVTGDLDLSEVAV